MFDSVAAMNGCETGAQESVAFAGITDGAEMSGVAVAEKPATIRVAPGKAAVRHGRMFPMVWPARKGH